MRRTYDLTRVASVLKHPSIFPGISDDYTLPDWEPPPGPIYLMPDNDGACISFEPDTAVMWKTHAAILPEYRERYGRQWAQEAADWMRANTPCRCLVVFIYGPGAKLVESIGFTHIGTIPRSKLRGGVLLDQKIYAKSI